jgi:hypothetical protein
MEITWAKEHVSRSLEVLFRYSAPRACELLTSDFGSYARPSFRWEVSRLDKIPCESRVSPICFLSYPRHDIGKEK